MPDHTFTLYVDSKFISPYAMSAFVTLIEKGFPFEIQTVNLDAQENQQSDYSNLSLTRRVPTLTHGDFHLSESSAISEYLEELAPADHYPQVYPTDIQEKALARQIQAWLRSDFIPIREERPTEVIFFKPVQNPLSELAQASAEKLFAAVDRLLEDNAQNLFNQWCIADTDLALLLNRLVMNGDNVPEKLVAYAQYQWKRPSVQVWVNQKRSP
ncbi:MAG: glutathione transferase [Leptolyngbyaceae cyanobacterium MO_188.B28]|nr:glutathione transferase [Leptolyngbyaceae cyanobacterium MO_188.B28]